MLDNTTIPTKRIIVNSDTAKSLLPRKKILTIPMFIQQIIILPKETKCVNEVIPVQMKCNRFVNKRNVPNKQLFIPAN